MFGMVSSLSEQDMADLDAYYASQSSTIETVSMDRSEDALAGESLYRTGYAPFNVPACMGCHGPAGAGIPPKYPRLGGQHAAYLESQLLAFKSGERQNAEMETVAFPLSDQQIRQLSLYLSGLQP